MNDKFRGSIIRLRFYCFRNCNSNISSCTTSNSIEYHIRGSHVVHMSIFQLSGFPYKYDDSYLTVIFSTSLYIMSHVSYHGLTLIIVRICKSSRVFIYTLDSNQRNNTYKFHNCITSARLPYHNSHWVPFICNGSILVTNKYSASQIII